MVGAPRSVWRRQLDVVGAPRCVWRRQLDAVGPPRFVTLRLEGGEHAERETKHALGIVLFRALHTPISR